ncbi:MAG: membrane or secreted protein [Bacteroidota bacterium]
MKKTTLFLLLVFTCSFISAQSLVGAWERFETTKDGKQLHNVVIFSDGFQVSTWYDAKSGEFLSTNGGSWKLIGKTITETVEFDTETPERVGSTTSFDINVSKTKLKATAMKMTWTRIDNGAPGALAGAWLMSGRKRDGEGEIQQRDTNRPRKTMKILSGTRFQWIAYNTETKKFSGTGGGTYTTIDGKYTENIEFFSRDNSRVGASLGFNYELVDSKWHHSGKSSKGAPLYEVWSIRK